MALALQEPSVEPASTPERRTVSAIERALLDAGFENVTVQPGDGIQIAYENRRYRRSAEALAVARAASGERILVGERRLGLLVASIEPPERATDETFRVRYPSDAWFPPAPEDALRSPTFRRADVEVGALVDYHVGRIFDPLQINTQLEPRLLLNPWPGARVRLGVAFPLQSDFSDTEQEPDLNRARPGRCSLDQFAWVPELALVSVSGGYFGDNRWGASAGIARPLRGGEWLLDAQVDRTGYLAFPEDGTVYSPPERTSGFAGVTYGPPVPGLALKLRVAQFVAGDRGVDLEVRRSFDDFDVAYFVQRTDGLNFFGVRLALPIPPRTRASGSALRVQPVPRFAMDFRDQDLAQGTFVDGVASREEFLRQLDPSSLAASRGSYMAGLGAPNAPGATGPEEWVSFTGMSGFVNTPWAGVVADRRYEVGFGHVPRKWAYDHRGTNDNQIFYGTLGFLPRVETAIRWTRIPGYRSFEEIAPDSRLVDMDRMASARVALLEPALGRPGVAIGVEDAQGWRRFHSTYAVAGLPITLGDKGCRVSAGYAFKVFEVHQRVLNGTFGAAEVSPLPWLRAQLEYDTEKWNAGLGVNPGAGFHVRAALLNLESLSVGAGWSHTL